MLDEQGDETINNDEWAMLGTIVVCCAALILAGLHAYLI